MPLPLPNAFEADLDARDVDALLQQLEAQEAEEAAEAEAAARAAAEKELAVEIKELAKAAEVGRLNDDLMMGEMGAFVAPSASGAFSNPGLLRRRRK